ncbi:PhoH family protein [Agaribacterium sp. ZY112]|uniref:PhoH family protein n=1 Tax=Agaribacterium sp. ZY112 TaxID=3233574 RepID=UPI0035251C60
MNSSNADASFTLEPNDNRRIALVCGQLNSHLKQIEKRLEVEIRHRANNFRILGESKARQAAQQILTYLFELSETENDISPDQVHLAIQEAAMEAVTESEVDAAIREASVIHTKKASIKPRGGKQTDYVAAVRRNDINFGIGPAGTGKTYLAVACAVEALMRDDVERILLVRPAVEAGEKLGFLPGDLSQKVDPYLRPLYDALYEMLGFETVGKLIERSVIEIAPLAYMRGRTLNNSFIILDESQNTTREQMKMFLTRIGFGSTAVITGDPSQIDLPRGQKSGLNHAIDVLDGVDGISFSFFTSRDVVRHAIVQRIVEAYDRADQREHAADAQKRD